MTNYIDRLFIFNKTFLLTNDSFLVSQKDKIKKKNYMPNRTRNKKKN